MKSYFFVPGTRLHKIETIQNLKISEIIIDLEDAVAASQRREILNKLLQNSEYQNFYIRIPLYDSKDELEISIFTELYKKGYRKFVFPKIQKVKDFKSILSENSDSDLKIILLIETARLFLEAKDVLLQNTNIFSGIGIGSHDFMSEIGGEHTLQNLKYVRLQILYLARMINIDAIDIASMNLNDGEEFKNEIIDGFKKGYDAKFFIHPWQIDVYKSIPLYGKQELEWAQKVLYELQKVNSDAEFNPIVIDGQIIERPHLAKARKIIQYYETK